MDEAFRPAGELVVAADLVETLGPPMTTRLEPQSLSGDPAAGLAARVWDPLWLLGRQWQVGEFRGEDTGTPVTVRVEAELDPLVAWHPGPLTGPSTGPPADDGWLTLDPDRLLEARVDAEPSLEIGGRRLAYAGWALLDTLTDLGATRAVDRLRKRFPAEPAAQPADEPGRAAVPDSWSPVGRLASRGVDPERVAREFEDAAPARPRWWRNALRDGSDRRESAEEALAGWLAWYRAEVSPVDGPPPSWIGPQLEHDFALATGSLVLRAPAHPGGEITWSAVDLVPGQAPPPSDRAPRRLERTVVATPLSFPGMPASRFWELEDARVDLGSVWADPHELARLLVVECALVYGGDWLVVPVDVPCGGVARVTSVVYTDTFGETWRVPENRPERPETWRMYAVTSVPSVADADADHPSPAAPAHLDGLFVPPASSGRLQGPPVEEVAFLRDEAANMVWAIEHLVPGPGGDPAVPRARPAPPPHRPEPHDGEPVLGYTLMTQVPETWTPYLPRLAHDVTDPGVTLVRGQVRRYDGATELEVSPAGTLLAAEEHRAIDSAEVPRQGVRVRRVPMVARRGDGGWEAWTARRVTAGRGEGESGLRSDHLT